MGTMKTRSVIVIHTFAPSPLVHGYVRIGTDPDSFVRRVVVEGTALEALDEAGKHLLPGEAVCNTHEIPDDLTDHERATPASRVRPEVCQLNAEPTGPDLDAAFQAWGAEKSPADRALIRLSLAHLVLEGRLQGLSGITVQELPGTEPFVSGTVRWWINEVYSWLIRQEVNSLFRTQQENIRLARSAQPRGALWTAVADAWEKLAAWDGDSDLGLRGLADLYCVMADHPGAFASRAHLVPALEAEIHRRDPAELADLYRGSADTPVGLVLDTLGHGALPAPDGEPGERIRPDLVEAWQEWIEGREEQDRSLVRLALLHWLHASRTAPASIPSGGDWVVASAGWLLAEVYMTLTRAYADGRAGDRLPQPGFCPENIEHVEETHRRSDHSSQKWVDLCGSWRALHAVATDAPQALEATLELAHRLHGFDIRHSSAGHLARGVSLGMHNMDAGDLSALLPPSLRAVLDVSA